MLNKIKIIHYKSKKVVFIDTWYKDSVLSKEMGWDIYDDVNKAVSFDYLGNQTCFSREYESENDWKVRANIWLAQHKIDYRL